MHQLCKGNFL